MLLRPSQNLFLTKHHSMAFLADTVARSHLTKLDDTEDVNTIDSRRNCRPEEAQLCCRCL